MTAQEEDLIHRMHKLIGDRYWIQTTKQPRFIEFSHLSQQEST